MKMTICEQASNNADGTFSIVRGGLDRFELDMPAQLGVVLFIEATLDEAPRGTQHSLMLSCSGCGADGGLAGYAATPPDAGTVVRFIMPLSVPLNAHGTLRIAVKIGEHEVATEVEIKPSAVS